MAGPQGPSAIPTPTTVAPTRSTTATTTPQATAQAAAKDSFGEKTQAPQSSSNPSYFEYKNPDGSHGSGYYDANGNEHSCFTPAAGQGPPSCETIRPNGTIVEDPPDSFIRQ